MDERRRKFLEGFGSEEVVLHLAPSGRIEHGMTDNDGTYSNLRWNWKTVMEDYMMGVLVTDGFPEHVVESMRSQVRRLIHETDGVNTIEQMVLFREIVDEWAPNFPGIQRLEPETYKAAYVCKMQAAAAALHIELCEGRKLPGDVTVPGAIDFFHRFQQAGGQARIVSGTDDGLLKADVHIIACASGLHMEDIFFSVDGALKDRQRSSKEARMDEFLRMSGLKPSDVFVSGDGPIELVVAKQFGCYAIGIAKDQDRREFLTRKLREGLEKRGLPFQDVEVDLFIPDFGHTDAQRIALVEFLMAA